jgi:hypothetical protein
MHTIRRAGATPHPRVYKAVTASVTALAMVIYPSTGAPTVLLIALGVLTVEACWLADQVRDLSRRAAHSEDMARRSRQLEQAVATLQHDALTLAQQAIGLYREYQDVHGVGDPERAAALAVLEIMEGSAAADPAHTSDTPEQHHAGRVTSGDRP